MAADEMRSITTDKWSDDIWGTLTSTSTSSSHSSERSRSSNSNANTDQNLSKLIFYFGRNDHWVAERTRDEIIAMKSCSIDGATGPKMVVCEEGLPHAFCIRKYRQYCRRLTFSWFGWGWLTVAT
jgi:hypothetical protein